MKPAARVTVLLLGFIAVLHVLRIAFQVPATAGTVTIPMWASLVGVLIPGGLAVWLWREQRQG